MVLRVVADVHGRYDQFAKLCKSDIDYVVQLGDFGFDLSYLERFDPDRVKILAGNHDNYDAIPGYSEYFLKTGMNNLHPWCFFAVRGAFSIDVNERKINQYKTGVKSWWGEEQLNYKQGKRCLSEYQAFVENKISNDNPVVVLSHSCPDFVSKLVGKPGILRQFGWHDEMVTSTQELLQDMYYSCCEPDIWVFGHYHINWQKEIGMTLFICREELGYVDFDEDWNVVNWGIGVVR